MNLAFGGEPWYGTALARPVGGPIPSTGSVGVRWPRIPNPDGRTLVEPDGSAMAELYALRAGGDPPGVPATGDRHQAKTSPKASCGASGGSSPAGPYGVRRLPPAIVNLHTRRATYRTRVAPSGRAPRRRRPLSATSERAVWRRCGSPPGNAPRWCSATTNLSERMPPRRSAAAAAMSSSRGARGSARATTYAEGDER
jgi:hypothetical protein